MRSSIIVFMCMLMAMQCSSHDFSGTYLTIQELEEVKNGALLQRLQAELDAIKTSSVIYAHDAIAQEQLQKKFDLYQRMQKVLFWYQSFPTTGMRLEAPFYPPKYPFIPHYFSLWQLAPKKGAGVTVALLDTGVAAFAVKDNPFYIKHPDLTMHSSLMQSNLNLSGTSNNQFKRIAQLVKRYLTPENQTNAGVIEQLPGIIIDYLSTNDTAGIIALLKQKGEPALFENGALTVEGRNAVTAITIGPSGIKPGGKRSTLTLAQLIQPLEQDVIVQFLPAPKVSKTSSIIAGHGSHTFGLIAGQLHANTLQEDTGITGLAPNARVIMIKAFDDMGKSDKVTLIEGIKKALDYHAQVVSLSLKITDQLDLTGKLTQELQHLIARVPYMIAASGNNGDSELPDYAGTHLAYPARFASVPFDVGAFGWDGQTVSIAPFSQYEPGIGPKFVAPGVTILSAGIKADDEQARYLFFNGTSMASAIMTGFVALMLSEFQHDFTREQLLKVCYRSTVVLSDSPDWKNKVLLGAVDMRMVLFMLHVLRSIKQKVAFDFDQKFDNVVQALYEQLLHDAHDYAQRALGGVSFEGNLMGYITMAQAENNNAYLVQYYKPTTLRNAVHSSAQRLLHAITDASRSTNALFGDYTSAMKERIHSALHSKEN